MGMMWDVDDDDDGMHHTILFRYINENSNGEWCADYLQWKLYLFYFGFFFLLFLW